MRTVRGTHRRHFVADHLGALICGVCGVQITRVGPHQEVLYRGSDSMSTPNFAWPYPVRTDPADMSRDLQQLALGVEATLESIELEISAGGIRYGKGAGDDQQD